MSLSDIELPNYSLPFHKLQFIPQGKVPDGIDIIGLNIGQIKNLVYGWRRTHTNGKNVYLYIGMSHTGFSRFDHHPTIDKAEDFNYNKDTVDIWLTDNPGKLESDLLKLHMPKYNARIPGYKHYACARCSRPYRALCISNIKYCDSCLEINAKASKQKPSSPNQSFDPLSEFETSLPK